MRKLLPIVILVLGILTLPLSLNAEGFDGSKPLICAVWDAYECTDDHGCESRSIDDLDLPRFINIDFHKKIITGSLPGGQMKETPLKEISLEKGLIILQGMRTSRPWSLVISGPRGNLSVSVVADNAVFSVFGACQAQ